LTYHLLKNPDKYHAAQQEVDRVVGDGAIELKHLSQLKYIEACIRETLRFQGPINMFVVSAKEDTVIGNRYRVPKGTSLQSTMKGLHHDPKVWGDDADIFRPERFLNGGYEALPLNSFKPFGNGRRACIGRSFAEQEMILATALILQRFQVELADPSYHLGTSFSPFRR
jgi:cytochrome P450/NADPH-cytochrome P450 reductase